MLIHSQKLHFRKDFNNFNNLNLYNEFIDAKFEIF